MLYTLVCNGYGWVGDLHPHKAVGNSELFLWNHIVLKINKETQTNKKRNETNVDTFAQTSGGHQCKEMKGKNETKAKNCNLEGVSKNAYGQKRPLSCCKKTLLGIPSNIKKLNSNERGALFRHFCVSKVITLRMRTKVVSFLNFSQELSN